MACRLFQAMRATLQDVFRQHFGQYAKTHVLHPREQRAAYCISQCFQPAMGMHLLSCPQGHFTSVQHHACRHRCCPRCAEAPRQRWLAAQLPKLLPCPHFHVVFTLPHCFVGLWQFNRSLMARLLFDAARSSLLDLCADPRHLGALPGLLMALHTWGRNLSHHPHLHCLVSAGGLDSSGQWRASRTGFLLPLEPLRQLFRGRLLGAISNALQHQLLHLPPGHDRSHWLAHIKHQWRAHWNIQINPPYPHGRGVALYLARYAKGGPLGCDRRLHLHPTTVSFAYLDHLDAKRKNLTLSTSDFISRILWHAPPKGQHTIRHAGLYATSRCGQHHSACQQLRPPPPPPRPPQTLASHALPPNAPTRPNCPTCNSPLQRRSFPPCAPPPPHHLGEISKPHLHRPANLGPTNRCNGHLTGGRDPPHTTLGRIAPACQMPLN